jgi:EAL domain-containing protein (putative c-di-GMP-specific phosphodiesterase class I)
VLHKACRQLSAWLLDGWDLWLSVNVSRAQLSAPTFATAVHDALYTHQVTADRLTIEIAEPSLPAPAHRPGASGADVRDLDQVVAQLAAMRAVGVRTALDHFGVGPTSLADLRRLPLDVLKLDQSMFTEPAGSGGQAAPIIDVVVDLGRRLGLDIIAVGLEDQVHLDLVREAGCRYGQGYLYGRPAPAERVEASLEQYRTPRM